MSAFSHKQKYRFRETEKRKAPAEAGARRNERKSCYGFPKQNHQLIPTYNLSVRFRPLQGAGKKTGIAGASGLCRPLRGFLLESHAPQLNEHARNENGAPKGTVSDH